MKEYNIVYNYETRIDENGNLQHIPAIYDYNTQKYYTIEKLYDQNQALNLINNIYATITGFLIITVFIYILYKTHKINKIELNSEYPKSPPVRTLIFGILLIAFEIIMVVVNGGDIGFGKEINTLIDVFALILYLLGYFIYSTTGIVLVISFIKRKKHYMNYNK